VNLQGSGGEAVKAVSSSFFHEVDMESGKSASISVAEVIFF